VNVNTNRRVIWCKPRQIHAALRGFLATARLLFVKVKPYTTISQMSSARRVSDGPHDRVELSFGAASTVNKDKSCVLRRMPEYV